MEPYMQLLGVDDPAPAARATLGDAAFEAGVAAGRSMTLDEAVALIEAGTA